ncbi:MAG: tryptophan-rich sensory protein [Ruminococcaceae bacterium]|nr:tryptophan-rich sensory protein [Oscillospiraceae bacterium]
MSVIKRIFAEIRCSDKKYIVLCSALALFLGALSAFFGGNSIMYNHLDLPRSSPPRFIFVLTWTIMFLLLGASAGMIFQKREKSLCIYKYKTLTFFSLNFCLDLVWYPLFFGARAFFLSTVLSLAISVSAFFMLFYSKRISVTVFTAFFLYFVWILYSFILNFVLYLWN